MIFRTYLENYISKFKEDKIMSVITTVRGDIAPETLGAADMHDHAFMSSETAGEYMAKMFGNIPEQMLAFTPENYGFLKSGVYLLSKELQHFDDEAVMTKEYGYLKGMGVNALCEPSPIGIRGNIEKYRKLSETLDMHIICATGLYHEIAMAPEYRGHDESYYYNLFRQEIENGIDGTDIKPGIIKGALASGSPTERAVVTACIHLSAETGMSAHIHTEPTTPEEVILEVIEGAVEKYGADPTKIVIMHMDNRIAQSVSVDAYLTQPGTDRTLNLDIQRKLLAKGYNIGLDTWGMPITNPQFFMPDDFERLKALITLINEGYAGQITLGNDFSNYLQARTYGGYGTTRFLEFGIGRLKQMGMDEAVQKLLVENPARILAH